jgi:urease accessory protein
MSIEPAQLLLLLHWMSPAFPTGAFAYSHGLESAIERRLVASAMDVEDWASDLMSRGSGWNDAVLFAQIWDRQAAEVNELALALVSSSERFLETVQLGRAFSISASIWAKDGVPSDFPVAYPVAAALACRAAGISKEHALLAFLQGFANSLVSVAVRLVPLGQTQGLETIRNLMPVISATASRAAKSAVGDLGSITIKSDIAAMKHESQHSRVFRS